MDKITDIGSQGVLWCWYVETRWANQEVSILDRRSPFCPTKTHFIASGIRIAFVAHIVCKMPNRPVVLPALNGLVVIEAHSCAEETQSRYRIFFSMSSAILVPLIANFTTKLHCFILLAPQQCWLILLQGKRQERPRDVSRDLSLVASPTIFFQP